MRYAHILILVNRLDLPAVNWLECCLLPYGYYCGLFYRVNECGQLVLGEAVMNLKCKAHEYLNDIAVLNAIANLPL